MANTLEKIMQGIVIVGACFAGTRLLTNYTSPVEKEQTQAAESQQTEYKQEKKETPAEKAREKKIEKIEKELASEPKRIVEKSTTENPGDLFSNVLLANKMFAVYINNEKNYGEFVLATNKYVSYTLADINIRYTDVTKELDVITNYTKKFGDNHPKSVEKIVAFKKRMDGIKDVKREDMPGYVLALSSEAFEITELLEKTAKDDLEFVQSFNAYMTKVPNLKLIKILSPVVSDTIAEKRKLIEACSEIKGYLKNNKEKCQEYKKDFSTEERKGYHGNV